MTLAERDTSRFADLYEHGLVSKQTLDEVVQRLTIARAARAVLDAQMQRDLSNLSYTKIFAPVAGVVLSREVAVGQTVAASFQTPELFKIAEDLSKIHIECSIPEIDIGAVKVGQRVEFTVDAFPQKRFSGRTRQVRIDPSISEGIVSYSVIVDVSNSGRELLPGMTAQVEIILDEHRHVLRVPNAAVMFAKERGRVSGQDAGNKSVYIPDGHDDVVAIPVRLGLVGIEYTEILDGTLGLASVVVVGDQQSTSDD
jgi:HlyD family secretion protein